MYDVVIIGAGPAGLYTALLLEENIPGIRIAIVEKNEYIGGRTKMAWFHSVKVVTGAGIGRYDKDTILRGLLEKHLGVRVEPRKTVITYQKQPVDVRWYTDRLVARHTDWIAEHRSTRTFRQCFTHFFGRARYKDFCQTNGYTDFQDADIVDTLCCYGFEDNRTGNRIFTVDWDGLMSAMAAALRATDIFLGKEVTRYRKTSGGVFYCGHGIRGRTVVFAGSVDALRCDAVKRQIRKNTFLRLYTFTHKPVPACPMLYRTDVLQKTIAITPHIQMLSYSDNANARATLRLDRDGLSKMAAHPVDDMVSFVGWTHYYKPLPKKYNDRWAFIDDAQNPSDGIFVVGELISMNQGWTEGAFESVRRILPKLLRRHREVRDIVPEKALVGHDRWE